MLGDKLLTIILRKVCNIIMEIKSFIKAFIAQGMLLIILYTFIPDSFITVNNYEFNNILKSESRLGFPTSSFLFATTFNWGLLSDNCKIFVLTDFNHYWLDRPKTGKTCQYIRDHKNFNDILLVSTVIIDILVVAIAIVGRFYKKNKRETSN